jgi:hypothetical protein
MLLDSSFPIAALSEKLHANPDLSRRRRLHLPFRPLSDDDGADVRALLPLQVVSTRNGRGVRHQRHD